MASSELWNWDTDFGDKPIVKMEEKEEEEDDEGKDESSGSPDPYGDDEEGEEKDGSGEESDEESGEGEEEDGSGEESDGEGEEKDGSGEESDEEDGEDEETHGSGEESGDEDEKGGESGKQQQQQDSWNTGAHEGQDVDENEASDNLEAAGALDTEDESLESQHQTPELSSPKPADDDWSDEGTNQSIPKAPEPEKKGGLFGWGRKKEEKQEVSADEENQAELSTPPSPENEAWFGKKQEQEPSDQPNLLQGEDFPSETFDTNEPLSRGHPEESESGESFHDEPSYPKEKSKGGWFGKKKSDEYEPAPEIEEDIEYAEPSGYAAPTGDGDVQKPRSRKDTFEDEPWADDSKRSRSWSSIEATQERKIITCLAMVVCCLIMLLMLGVGIGIGVAIGRDSKDEVAPTPPIPRPTDVPSPSPTPAPVSPMTPPPVVSPTRAPVVGSSAPTLSPAPTPTAPFTTSPTANETLSTPAPTSVSTPSPDPLLQLIIDNSFDDGAAVLAAGTPQNSAFEWLAENANLDDYTDETKVARYALATFHYSTDGPTSWDPSIRDNGWLTDAPECEWASTANGQCTDGIYTSLTVDYVGVSGQLPPEVGMLTGLNRLSVRSNGAGSSTLSGSLPSSFGNLTDMVTIRLNDNEIGGTLPTAIGLMTSLRVLLLSGNSIGGNIPSEIGLIDGNTINIDNNEMTGNIPTELFGLAALIAINLEKNFFTGPIPSEIGSVPNLSTISFATNDLSGSIPSEIGRLAAIRAGIDLSDNYLTGTLPTQIGLLASMRNFLLQDNRLTGTVPVEFANLSDLRTFRIEGNPSITGSMPQLVCSTFEAASTISYSDCSLSFSCPCCTFCCQGGLCTCNSDDASLCDA